jgi:hypothetical protein
MNHIFTFHALRELAQNERARRDIGQMVLMYIGAVVIVVLSFPVFRYLA